MAFNKLDTMLDIIAGLTGTSKNNYGLTEPQMKAKFDEGPKLLKEDINNLIDQLEAGTAAGNLGYGETNIGAVLATLEAAGVGTLPPDDSLTTAKYQDASVTEDKLATAVTTKLNAIKIKAGTITPTYQAGQAGVTINPLGTNETINAEQDFNIGFTPTAVIVFSLKTPSYPMSSTITVKPYAFDIGYQRERTDYYEYYCYGGAAITDNPMTVQVLKSSLTTYNIISIIENGFKLHRVERPSTGSTDKYSIGMVGTLYYIAIG